MDTKDKQTLYSAGGLTLADLTMLAFQRWKTVVSSIAASVLIGFIYLHLSTPTYTVTAIVAPPPIQLESRAEEQGLSVSVLAGLRPQKTDLSRFAVLVKTLRFADKLAQDQTLLQQLFPAEWNQERVEWQEPNASIAKRIKNFVRWVSGQPRLRWNAPHAHRVQQFIDQNLILQTEKTTGMTTLVLQHKRPQTARAFLNKVVTVADEIMREEAISYHALFVEELEKSMQSVSAKEFRSALLSAYSDSSRRLILINSNLPYAVYMFQPPQASFNPTQPRISLTYVLFILVGLLISFSYIISSHNRMR